MIANPLIRPLIQPSALLLGSGALGGSGVRPTFLWEPVNGSFASTRGPTPAVSRASAGTYVDSSGDIQTAAINAPRITYDPVTHECLGYLAEEQRTNYAYPSTGIPEPTAPLAPDGITRMARTVGFGAGRNVLVGGTASKTFTFSVWATGSGTMKLKNTHGGVMDNFSPEIVLTSTPTRYSFTVTNSSNAGNGLQIIDILCNGGEGTTAAFVDYWGLQLEDGFLSSIIPTGDAPVTRSADVCSISGADFAGFYNQSEGSWVIECASENILNSPRIFLGPGVGPQSIGKYNGQTSWYDGSNNLVGGSVGVSCVLAAAYNGAGRAICVNGGSVSTDAIPLIEQSQIAIGARGDFAQHLNGTIARIAYYPVRLTDEKLIELTQP
jgi:hypothetical protein